MSFFRVANTISSYWRVTFTERKKLKPQMRNLNFDQLSLKISEKFVKEIITYYWNNYGRQVKASSV
jgi:hypothetical protein